MATREGKDEVLVVVREREEGRERKGVVGGRWEKPVGQRESRGTPAGKGDIKGSS